MNVLFAKASRFEGIAEHLDLHGGVAGSNVELVRALALEKRREKFVAICGAELGMNADIVDELFASDRIADIENIHLLERRAVALADAHQKAFVWHDFSPLLHEFWLVAADNAALVPFSAFRMVRSIVSIITDCLGRADF
jgi:hypothetical protein